MIGLAFLVKYFYSKKKKPVRLVLSSFFIFFSFFTKQDAGGLAFILCLFLLIYYCLKQKTWSPLVIYVVSLTAIAIAIIGPLLKYNFSYWFNYGQPPHTSRISIFEILDEFLMSSQWIKFYLLLIVFFLFAKYGSVKQIFHDQRNAIFLLVTLGILVEASILQVTSYTPPDNNIFFHSFAFAFIFSSFSAHFHLDFNKIKRLVVACALLLLWWSGIFWKYFDRITGSAFTKLESQKTTSENVVNKNTYLVFPSEEIPMNQWGYSSLKSFKDIAMPKQTIEGIDRLLKNPLVKNNKNINILNMTELTPLAVEIPYQLETGSDIPLWYHLGVGMFNKQASEYENKILKNYYDLVLFEYVPHLNNFYPFRIRDTLLNHCQMIDSFPAPRKGNTPGIIEVFLKRGPY
jgi:hypothetical protein